MLTVADIMTCPVMQLHEGNTLHDAHYITRHRGIRHLPVVNKDTQKIIGVVTQKSLIAKVMSLMVLYGNGMQYRASVWSPFRTSATSVEPNSTSR